MHPRGGEDSSLDLEAKLKQCYRNLLSKTLSQNGDIYLKHFSNSGKVFTNQINEKKKKIKILFIKIPVPTKYNKIIHQFHYPTKLQMANIIALCMYIAI